ncbi:MAG: glycosyl transferase family 2 [Lachnospiraceae bacterium]|nr:glycosyl transferase family 2 [Lachnospiraceae bacterium]
MNQDQKFISAVAAVDADRKELTGFLDLIVGALSERFSQGELILVVREDHEGGDQEIREYFTAHPTGMLISIVTMDRTSGKESAMNAGRDLAIGDYVFEFDDIHVDYDAAVIGEAYEKCLEGYDIVTVRSDKKARFTSGLFYRTFNRLSGVGRKLGPSTLRVLSRRAINRVKSLGTYIPYRKAVYEHAGLTSTEVLYHSTDPERKNRHTIREERGDLAFDSFIYFTKLMERLSLGICALFFAIAVGVVIYIVCSLIADEQLMSGWVSIMGFLSIGFTGLFGLLTIVIKYLSVLVDLTFRRQRYLIRDIEKISGV